MSPLAECLQSGCDWTATGPIEHVEREARRHGGELVGGPKPGHPTAVSLRGAQDGPTRTSARGSRADAT